MFVCTVVLNLLIFLSDVYASEVMEVETCPHLIPAQCHLLIHYHVLQTCDAMWVVCVKFFVCVHVSVCMYVCVCVCGERKRENYYYYWLYYLWLHRYSIE